MRFIYSLSTATVTKEFDWESSNVKLSSKQILGLKLKFCYITSFNDIAFAWCNLQAIKVVLREERMFGALSPLRFGNCSFCNIVSISIGSLGIHSFNWVFYLKQSGWVIKTHQYFELIPCSFHNLFVFFEVNYKFFFLCERLQLVGTEHLSFRRFYNSFV